MKNLSRYGQYKKDIFEKMGVNFQAGKKILDVGCGDGTDAEIFIKEFELDCSGIDIYRDDNLKKIENLKFVKGGIYQIPFPDNTFDYVFLHDVLHHIDEKNQNYKKHIAGLEELKRVCKEGGHIVVLEANRYNPLFYFHMVRQLGHNHFRQPYFRKIFKNVFGENVTFKYFECHFYPKKFLGFWKIYEYLMEHFIPSSFLSYNLAIIKNRKNGASGQKDSPAIIYKNGIPPKNKFIQLILHLRFPLIIPGFKSLIKRHLKYCENVDFIYGFRYLYGNIHATNAFLCDSFFVDYAPIYIGEGTNFSFENIIITSAHDPNDFKTVIAKPIRIGKNVWITSRCIILGGVTIGDNSIIGAGSVVTKDIPSNCIAVGNPAKVIRYLNQESS